MRPAGAPTARRRPSAAAAPNLRPRLYTLGALAVSALVLAACLLGLFTVRTVQIVGKNLPAAAMIQAAGVTGQNIFTVRSDQVIDRLAAVSSVEVTRVQTAFPDRVVIYAQLRQPAVVWQSPQGKFLVDRYGHVIGPAASGGLPVVSANQAPDSGTITAAGYALRLLPPAPDGAIAGLTIDSRTGLTIQGRSGWTAVIGRGDAQTLVNRIATLQALLGALAGRGQHLAYADMRYRGPYYRVRGS
jgi:cell division protein FtsQ